MTDSACERECRDDPEYGFCIFECRHGSGSCINTLRGILDKEPDILKRPAYYFCDAWNRALVEQNPEHHIAVGYDESTCSRGFREMSMIDTARHTDLAMRTFCLHAR